MTTPANKNARTRSCNSGAGNDPNPQQKEAIMNKPTELSLSPESTPEADHTIGECDGYLVDLVEDRDDERVVLYWNGNPYPVSSDLAELSKMKDSLDEAITFLRNHAINAGLSEAVKEYFAEEIAAGRVTYDPATGIYERIETGEKVADSLLGAAELALGKEPVR